jgi:ribosomal protein S18 acetylase RimI-like enzyme
VVAIRIIDIADEAGFARIPPCADPGFDHRTCDYWEDAARGSKASRLAWLQPSAPPPERPVRPVADNPFLADLETSSVENPFAIGRGPAVNPFAVRDDTDAPNPFAPASERRPAVASDAPRKLQLLARGTNVVGSYAKVLERDDVPVAYCQFGPLTAYPRAQQTRDLYPRLPSAPLPAVITCIATTREARGEGLGLRLVQAVCEDLTARGFAAVEAYPEVAASPDATSAATPAFWLAAGFGLAIDDERFPVMRRELT